MRAETVASALRHAISGGQYRPGQQLVEAELTASYEVSRNTLREAFRMLEHDGIIVRHRNRGCFIAQPVADDVADIYTARLIIEPGALRHATNIDVASLWDIVHQAQAAVKADKLGEVAGLNQLFHRHLVACAGSPTLDQTMDSLLARLRLVFLAAVDHDPQFHVAYVDDNAQVCAYLEEGARERAASFLEERLRATLIDVRGVLGQ